MWIAQALPAKEYPADKHGFVMKLMEKFEVAFALEAPETTMNSTHCSIKCAQHCAKSAVDFLADATAGVLPKEPQRWLIPELLPEAFEEFRQPGVKRLRFTYPQALLPGLLPRLIVRTHEMSEAHQDWRWRSGVVLEWLGARALVRLDRNEWRTEVAVIGGTPEEQQSLFDIIRAHLTVLHGKVPWSRKRRRSTIRRNGWRCASCAWPSATTTRRSR